MLGSTSLGDAAVNTVMVYAQVHNAVHSRQVKYFHQLRMDLAQHEVSAVTLVLGGAAVGAAMFYVQVHNAARSASQLFPDQLRMVCTHSIEIVMVC